LQKYRYNERISYSNTLYIDKHKLFSICRKTAQYCFRKSNVLPKYYPYFCFLQNWSYFTEAIFAFKRYIFTWLVITAKHIARSNAIKAFDGNKDLISINIK